jgi:hypothetical protein
LELQAVEYVLDKEPGGVGAEAIESSGYTHLQDIPVPIDSSTVSIYKVKQ